MSLLTIPNEKMLSQTQLTNLHVPRTERVASIILGGGEGVRLFPLTLSRCKPAIPVGGRYRLIDFSISNSLNSGYQKIFILTQFLSSSLHQHIFRTYQFDPFSGGFIELLPAEQKPHKKTWYQGTADAVRQSLECFLETPVDYFLILSGDQLYNMDFRPMLQFARHNDADLVVASLPVNAKDASRMGILKVNEACQIIDFCEKPKTEEDLSPFYLPHEEGKNYLGSMGIYLFKREVLFDLLHADPREDFGKHLIPTKVKEGGAFTYLYHGYWEDIGTIGSFYEANIALTRPYPPFNYYDEGYPIYTSRSYLPGAKILKSQIDQSIICEGSIVEASTVTHSILGPRSVIKKGTTIRNSYVMGNEFYAPPVQIKNRPSKLSIGKDCVIERAIIDKYVNIGDGVQLINKNRLTTFDGEHVFIRDGVIIVPRGANLPDGFII
ncbi:glucose-1-phosphate adenylyltransferase [Parachlamydia sp. AcF125]|uniref:glucose-1-phosphate adenylyltransferase n=1 Tax=Parachlamydia sp. AcF125 TaxID=2795736 RepID=UPI001BC967E6|nr:glucose-1-phosphate adenylyltransferase [Parachlamydia sp. AcF125]MBS4169013.1 Glucose-1-phosphate adenylyltransferase [Parachlamydia sp. AcF125]